ncbi:MAG: hypothetical protein M0000_10695 [Actinomycetota bacterium]|nr:hypothetical protein [Actinomycetota bacterium]
MIEWVISDALNGKGIGTRGRFADPRLSATKLTSLTERVRYGVDQFPCAILFVHRDAEASQPAERLGEISVAAGACGVDMFVPIVPVRMTEAWLLIDEAAVRRAAGNPNGTVPLDFPKARDLEHLHNPKEVLHQVLVLASEHSGRRLHSFRQRMGMHVHRVAELIGDFRPLRSLEAFGAFETATRAALNRVLQ